MNRFFDQARPLLWLGILGLALAAFCSAAAAAYGLMIPPEGDLTKAITFDAALGIYLITIALFVPLAGFTPKGRRRWLGWSVGLTLYSYATETIQMFRGVDPRFTRVGGPIDQLTGLVFFLSALGLIVLFAILAGKLVRQPLWGPNGLVLLAIRYASLATMVAFAGGIWMVVLRGRFVGESGNILPLHAIGFHGLQAVPLVAVLLTRSNIPAGAARPWVHTAGVTWIGICLAVAWQTAAGLPVTRLSTAMLLAWVLTLAWVLSLLMAARYTLSAKP